MEEEKLAEQTMYIRDEIIKSKKRKGILSVSCELGSVDICKLCAIKHQERLGIKQEAIDYLNKGDKK